MAEREGEQTTASSTPFKVSVSAFQNPQVYTFCTLFPDLAYHDYSGLIFLRMSLAATASILSDIG